MRVRQITVLAWVAVLAVGIVAGAALPAGATTPAEVAIADVSSGPFHVHFTAQRAADTPASAATGTFAAHGSIGNVSLFGVAGPVTCLDVRGNRMGLFYPIVTSSPPLLAQLHGGVFVSLVLNANGRPTYLGFAPTPMATAKSCAPGLALLPVTSGSATLTP